MLLTTSKVVKVILNRTVFMSMCTIEATREVTSEINLEAMRAVQ